VANAAKAERRAFSFEFFSNLPQCTPPYGVRGTCLMVPFAIPSRYFLQVGRIFPGFPQ
jgi:hypothetical protein